ncbi:MAG: hypothetical protein J6T00_01735 [Bacteroidaceae bacterium]|nr:hypothetical protein [Bacteroidaceae bacterium]
MMKDKALEDLFLAQKPQFDDSDAFMASLTRRLDAVEYLKQYQEATIRRYKMAMVATFVIGIISGAAGILFLLATPANVPLFTFRMQSVFLQWLSENSRILVAIALSLLMSFGLIGIIANIQDIVRMRKKRDSFSFVTENVL